MNYIAHAFLAPRDPIALLGNWLGDFVKGPLPGELDPEFADAVAAHRALDAECDRHPAFTTSRRRLFDEFSHYAGVVVDVVYDHLLRADWERYADEPFDDFVERAYAAVASHGARLPDAVRSHAERLVGVDVLRRYDSHDDLREAFRRMGKRLRRDIDLVPAVDRLIEHREDFASEFRALFDALVASRR